MLRAACPAPPRLPGQGTDTSFYWPLTEGGGMNGERLLTSTAGGGDECGGAATQLTCCIYC